MTAIADIFVELFYGSGAWLGLLLLISLTVIPAFKNKYLALIFIPVTVFLGISYLDHISLNSDLSWMALIMFLTSVFLLIRVVHEGGEK